MEAVKMKCHICTKPTDLVCKVYITAMSFQYTIKPICDICHKIQIEQQEKQWN